MKRTHCELIKAWADGAKIQFQNEATGNRWCDASDHIWLPTTNYRLKPPAIRFRNALFVTSDGGTYWVGSHQEGYEFDHKTFIRWVGDWQEVEV